MADVAMPTPSAPPARWRRNAAAIALSIALAVAGVIAAYFGVPAWQGHQRQVHAQETADAVQRFAKAFETFAREHGDWPGAAGPGLIPAGMEESLRDSAWSRVTPIGGNFVWQIDTGGMHAGISIVPPDAAHRLDPRAVEELLRALQKAGFLPSRLRRNDRNEPMFVLED